ncbi:protein kinase domain-containing protein [Candidatus Uabimicrobium amorphum]|uniref:protein kinase domain-containing protein n=1 Tax=Uabimicrobium amorphum TaxID=2596890 RepID=UPI0034A43C7F
MLSTQIISLIKRLLGDVEIKKSLGSSSLGISYLIQHPQHDLCALKILQGKVTQNEKFLLKFLRDLEANCKIFHPGMAEIFAIMKKGNYFILRRYQEGETLRQTIQKHKKMSEPEATAVLVTIVNVLREFCTRHQALKNLKPNNIILHEDGVTITDYSLPPTIAHFLSPEQCKGKKSTIQSDIYTLGAIYHYCLTGQTLYHGPYKKIMQAHISQPYPKIQSEIPQPVLQILDKMLCKDPEKRYNSYENLLQDLNKQVNAKDALDFSGASNLEKTIDIQVALAKEENQIDTTRKLVRDMIKKELQEVDIVPDEPEEISLEKIVKNLEEITNLSIPGTATRTMQFPKELKNDVLLYLQEKFYRKCWIFNQTNNDLELEIDIQEARIIQHLYHFEEHLKKIISDYKGFVENDGLTDFTGLQQHNIRIVQGNFNDQKHINIENSDSALENSKLNVKIASKDESSQEEGYGLPQLSGGDETVVGDLPQQSNTKEEHPSNFDSDLTIVGDQQVAPNASVPNLESDATIVASEGLPQVVDKVDNSLDSAMPNLESDATIVGGDGLPQVVDEVDTHNTFASNATIVSGNVRDFANNDANSETSYFQTDASEQPQESGGYFSPDAPILQQGTPENEGYFSPEFANSFTSDATIVSEEVSEVAQQVTDEHQHDEDSTDKNQHQDPAPLPQLSQESNFASDPTVVSDAISKVAQAIENSNNGYFSSDTDNSEGLPEVVGEKDSSMATDATIVGGNLSDFVAKEPDATPSYFESDSTILGNDLPQVVQEVENNTADNSMATDATIVGGNLSDFVAKEPDTTPSYFESDSTILGNDLPQVVQEVENNTADNSMATDVTVVGGNLSDFVAKEPDHTPNLEYDVTIVGDPTSANSQHQVLESDATIVGNNTANAVQSTPPSSNTASQQLDKKASISTTETRQSEKSRSALNSNDPTSFIMQVAVNFSNSYEVQSWKKFIEENDLKKGESYALIAIKEPKTHIFYVKLDWALHYFELKQKSTSIKDFFQSDYEISELGRGGMGMVLKLTTKFDGTILSIRPENRWSREYFKDHLCIRKGINNQEIVYAELPSGKSFVVKVAFKGCEESLIHEGNCLEKIAQREKISRCVVGLIQQGCLMAKNQEDNTHLGYYAMMEYGGDIATDQLCSMFPDNKLPITVGFMLLYGLTHALIELKEEGVIHRDIKPQNILLTEAGMPKLFDFGLAITTHAVNSELNEDNRRLLRVLDSDFLRISTECEFVHKRLKRLYERKVNMEEFNEQEMNHINNKIKMLETTGRQLQKKEHERAAELQHLCRPVTAEENVERPFAGSLYYAAPEQFKHENVLTHQCDVYQLGATLFTVLTGKKVVKAGNLHKLVEVILYSEKPRLDEHLPKTNLVKALSNLLVQMMRNKPQERIEIEAVKDELNNILFNHLDELTKPPIYDASNIQDPQARSDYYRKIAFVQRMFMKCLRNLHTYLDKLEKEQQENKKIFFTCPGCTKKLHISATMVGQKGCCPNCRHPIVVQITE